MAFRLSLPVAAGLLALALAAPAAAQQLSAADQATNADVRVGPAGEAPAAWLGEMPHFVLVGQFKDYRFDIRLTTPEALAEVGLSAKREYRPAEGGGLDYIDFEIALDFVTGTIERSLELEFENADFGEHAPPADFVLGAESFPAGPRSNLEFAAEWEWVEKSVVVNEEALMEAGTLTLALDAGEAGADGTAANGLIGGFVSARHQGMPLAISFTVPVTEAEIDG